MKNKKAIKSIELTAQNGLCVSCRLCNCVCPSKCISYELENGRYQPVINNSECISCGACTHICPGLKMYYPQRGSLKEAIYGDIYECYNAWSKDSKMRFVSGSGGVVSTIIYELLKLGSFDGAFCVGSFNYQKQVHTELVTFNDLQGDNKYFRYPKSRYISVSHEEAVKYIIENPDKRIILVGTSCAILGIKETLGYLHKDLNQYLLIGLFCDKVFNYNIWEYFSNTFSQNKELTEIHFKNKESGGWPGNMKLFFSDGSYEYLEKAEREKIKEYFMPERCLYCADKLNIWADISVGDNYTTHDSSEKGSNSVLIRTHKGEAAWNQIKDSLEYSKFDRDELSSAQYLDGRINNFYYAELKRQEIKKHQDADLLSDREDILTEDYKDYEMAWRRNLRNLHAGEIYSKDTGYLSKQIHLNQSRKNSKNIRTIGERFYYTVKRKWKLL